MSGGVDSSVAAALLVKAGYDVTGAFMVNYDDKDQFVSCWRGDYQDALRVAAKLRIPLLRLNFVREYKKAVLDYMYAEYKKGRTPNPDVLCNKFVKFGFWLKKAKELGFSHLATGHYAQLVQEGNQKSKIFTPLNSAAGRPALPDLTGVNIQLVAAVDDNKDQTYFLHQLNQNQLKHTMFPIGGYTKDQVRKLADKFGLPTAKKEESMGICFIGEVPMKDFLQKKIKAKKGKIILNNTGESLGSHEGVPFYTIGERIGLRTTDYGLQNAKGLRTTDYGLRDKKRLQTSDFEPQNTKQGSFTKPFFVIKKDVKKNLLFVGFENDLELLKKEIAVGEVNWISGQKPKLPLKCEVRLRHRQPLQQCHCEAIGRGNLIIKFKTPQRAVTPGQFAVFYSKGVCLGGGVVKR